MTAPKLDEAVDQLLRDIFERTPLRHFYRAMVAAGRWMETNDGYRFFWAIYGAMIGYMLFMAMYLATR